MPVELALYESLNLDLADGNDEFEDAKNLAAGLDQLSEVLEKIETAGSSS